MIGLAVQLYQQLDDPVSGFLHLLPNTMGVSYAW